MMTETATTITITGRPGKDAREADYWCDLCGAEIDLTVELLPGHYGPSDELRFGPTPTWYTFVHPLTGSESFACRSCAHAGTDRLRAIAFAAADRMEAHAAKARRQADELEAEAPKVRQIMGTADYATMELPGWKEAAYDQLAEGMRTYQGGMSWEEEDRARAYLGLPPAYENRQAELELADALARYDAAHRSQLLAVPGATR